MSEHLLIQRVRTPAGFFLALGITIVAGISNFGDRESNEAFYRCFYVERCPGLNVPWSEVYARAHFPPYEAIILPELARFCAPPEPRGCVLDVGCGDGFVLGYLVAEVLD